MYRSIREMLSSSNEKGRWMKLRLMILVPLMLMLVSVSTAAGAGLLSKFKAGVEVEEEYTDNLDLTPEGEKEDFITTVRPGITFSNNGDTFNVDLKYSLNAVFYKKNSNLDYIGHNASLNAGYDLTKRLNVFFRDYFIRSDDPREREYFTETADHRYVSAVKTERSVYWRNVASPGMVYRFGSRNSTGVTYRNNVYRTESKTGEDSREDYIEPFVFFSFDRQNEAGLTYGHTRGDFDRSPDLEGHRLVPRYTRHISPRTSVFGEYTYLKRDYEPPSTADYELHNPSSGVTASLSPTLTATAQLGYFWMDAESGSGQNGLSYMALLARTLPRTTYRLELNGGYGEDLFTSENLGFNRYNALMFSIDHRVDPKFSIGCNGRVEREKYEFPEHRDTTWEVNGLASYRLLKWLTLSLSAGHEDRESNEAGYEHTVNSAIFRATATY